MSCSIFCQNVIIFGEPIVILKQASLDTCLILQSVPVFQPNMTSFTSSSTPFTTSSTTSLFPSTLLPRVWRKIQARLATAPHPTLTFYISLEGKRFRSLQAARLHLEARHGDTEQTLSSPQVAGNCSQF